MSKLKKNWLKKLYLATALGAALLGQPKTIASTTEALSLKSQAELVINNKIHIIKKGSLINHKDAKDLYDLILLIQRDYALKVVEELSEKALRKQIMDVEQQNLDEMEKARWYSKAGVKAMCIARMAKVLTEVKVGEIIGEKAQKVVSQDFPKLIKLLNEFEKATRNNSVESLIKQLTLLKKATNLLEEYSKDNDIVIAFSKFGIKINEIVKLNKKSFADLYLKFLDAKENLNEHQIAKIKKAIDKMNLSDNESEKWHLLLG